MPDGLSSCEPGTFLSFRRSMVSFYPEGHPLRETDHGPLVPRGARVAYVGAWDERPGVHLCEQRDPALDVVWVIPFRLEDLDDASRAIIGR